MSNSIIKSHYKVSSLADLNSVSLKAPVKEKKKEMSVDNIYSNNQERNYLKNEFIKGSLIKHDSKNHNIYKDSNNSNTQEDRERKTNNILSNSKQNYYVKQQDPIISNSNIDPDIYPINYINKFNKENSNNNAISSKSTISGSITNKNERNFNKNIQIERSLSPFGESNLNKSFKDNKSIKGGKTTLNANVKMNYVYPHQQIQNLSMFKSIKDRPISNKSKQNNQHHRENSNVEYYVELNNNNTNSINNINRQKPVIKKQIENKSIVGLGNTFKISNMNNNYINNMTNKNIGINQNNQNFSVINNQNQFNRKVDSKNDIRAKSALNERKK